MQINGPFSVHGAQPIQPQSEVAPVDEIQIAESSIQPTDELALTGVHQVSDIRMDRVAEIRAQIADGSYETADKLEIAVGRLIDDLA